ncbi:MAG: hypothetical protein KTR31_16490 [Myxococcales bacterium]|nr:hypothetical protein [Myxococcales bacterium]
MAGGKAVELGRLARLGVPVPAGAVITTDVFRRVLQDAGLLPLAEAVQREPHRAQELARELRDMQLDPEVRAQWVATAARLGSRVAVRSSGVDEDGAARSFAGQHATFLSVSPQEVPDAVLRCWRSLYGSRAMVYRGSEGPAPGQLAVLVQEMVEPDCSGVMFTINPLNGSWREMVVESVWGLGEGLVSGQIAPHLFVLRRPRRLPRPFRRLAERVRLQVVEEDLTLQEERYVADAEGRLVRQAVPEPLRRRPTLRRPALRRLCRLGLRIERALGAPQDIEWARDRDGGFRVLQSRPITTHAAARPEGQVLWTRRFIGERWREPATPMGWSLLEPILSWYIAYPHTQEEHLGGGPALKLVHGRPYVNATVFRHLAFKLPGAPGPRFMMELIPPEEERAWRRRFAVAPDLTVYGSLLQATFAERRWRRFEWNPLTNPERWDAFVARLREHLPGLSRTPVDGPDAVRLVHAQLGWVREYVGIHICSLLFANLYWQLLESAVAAWLPQHRSVMEGLALSDAGNLTVRTNDALHALAQRATPDDLTALQQGRPLSAEAQQALSAFLEEYGHRAEASWEVMSPRWRTHPERLVPLLRAQRGSRPPGERTSAGEQRFSAAMALLREQLGGSRLRWMERLVRDTRRYLTLRENQRFWFDHLLAALQDTLHTVGGFLCEAGALSDAEDVAFLTWTEATDLITGASEVSGWAERVEERRAQRQEQLTREPPTFLVGDDVDAQEVEGSRRLVGLGISPGRVRGRVRVLGSVAEGSRLQPGDVLVTRAVDPAWTPLFLSAGAVVLELGGVLSHGAVVAREYGVPAVVNIEAASSRLVDGQEVTVDGHRGIVWVHDPGG